MVESIEYHSKMFNFPMSFSNNSSRQHGSSVSDAGHHSVPFSFGSVNGRSEFCTPDEATLLDSGLLARISPETIKFQLARMSTTSSCGNDGIFVIMLRSLVNTSFIEHLCQLYHACLRKGETPKRWNEACIYPLYKDKKKPYTASNSCPISLLCLFRKIFEFLILSTIRSSGNMTYSAIQAGFRSGYSTLTNVVTLHHLIEGDAGSHIVFLDFASAFDRVCWPFLRKKLEKPGINSLLLQLIYQLMYRDMTFSVIVNSSQSPMQVRTTGLSQGFPLSPTLFNRFVDSLLQTLNWQNASSFPSALFFADDGVLISPTLAKAQSLLNQVFRWSVEHGMSFNIAKCGYLITYLASKALVAIRPTLLLDSQSIPIVQSYKYLGVMFSSFGIDHLAQEEMLSQQAERHLGAILWFSNTWSPRIRLNIMKSILLPTLEYSVPLIYPQ